MKKILGLLLMGGLMISCTQTANDTSQEKIKYVKTETVSNHHLSSDVTFNSQVKEKTEIVMSFRVGGPVQKVRVKQGDYVKKGQIIAQIDQRDYLLQLEQTKTQYQQAKKELDRYQKLYDKNKLPENTYDKIKSGVTLAKIAYENAQNQLYDTDLRAPISGYISSKFINDHTTVGPGVPVVSMIDVSSLEVSTKVPSSQLYLVQYIKEAKLDIQSLQLADLPLEFKTISKKAGPDDLYELTFLLDSQDKRIKSGMLGITSVTLESKDTPLSVPLSAVFDGNQKTSVWVIQNGNKLKKRNVVLGKPLKDGRVEVLSGLQTEEKIVVAGVYDLIENQKVAPIQKPSKTNIGGLL
ncbi:efflux RND transporter periplasmic adaptor subunit [Flammeovirga yaeyamensis]|uniref:Efflux RND transporter periplasmic adaptor subunit n=1 Tax=Flammeovirga yaeyamensis TaxID=367791 RepID=A0AAX1NA00_9BACT|nr:efflux RND transporter periplasmic adaptor subunit [Flammeovirga yaeyamensis]MBB3697445.1 RND family efflux transporter MFP subunit [Flammeovirga yaeyamensis]NMF36139.1 efflux RND transporter periplasmic adaptor subunit [Flammeovirga yaeyamensis]QWG02872.1 efflux RND transporter periplasmic adaptor subunit [Flammeovirga yaeyamensis]